jgi:hypothetical protein
MVCCQRVLCVSNRPPLGETQRRGGERRGDRNGGRRGEERRCRGRKVYGASDRVYRVPGFLSSRPNCTPPHPKANVADSLVPRGKGGGGKIAGGGYKGGGGHFRWGRGGGGSQIGRRDRHPGILGIVESTE